MKTIYKKSLFTLLLAPMLILGFTACEDDDDGSLPANSNSEVKRYSATINMKQLANGNAVSLRSDAVKPYTNKKGQSFNISRLRYLISDIQFNKTDGSSFTIEEYHLVDLADNTTLTFTPDTKVPAGNYSSISFTFGFDSTDNQTGIYADLNTANWNWPSMLGNGYHFMQLEGKYDSLGTDRFFATHMGKARNETTTPVSFENNHFIAQPDTSAITVSGNFEFDIIMNVEQWYENPYEWDFTIWNAPIMPVYEAQKRLNENGPSVFTVNIP
jgi:hypothetical protein